MPLLLTTVAALGLGLLLTLAGGWGGWGVDLLAAACFALATVGGLLAGARGTGQRWGIGVAAFAAAALAFQLGLLLAS